MSSGLWALTKYRSEYAHDKAKFLQNISDTIRPEAVLEFVRNEVRKYIQQQRHKGKFSKRTLGLATVAKRIFARREDPEYVWKALQRAKKGHLQKALLEAGTPEQIKCTNCGHTLMIAERAKRKREIENTLKKLQRLGVSKTELATLMN